MGVAADACDSREFEIEIANGVPRLLKERHDEGAATHSHSAEKYLAQKVHDIQAAVHVERYVMLLSQRA